MSDYVRPLSMILLPNLGGFAGGFITKRNIKSWYELSVTALVWMVTVNQSFTVFRSRLRNDTREIAGGLKLPSWRPPNKVFPVAWTALYCSMGYASYLVWRDGEGFGGDAASPLAWYAAQLALNWTWTPLFFGLHSPKWAFVNIVCLWGSIVGTIYSFHGINETAAYLLLPYLGWVTFASALNYRIWKDNPSKTK